MIMILNSQIDPSKQIEGIYLVATEEGPRAEKETCFLLAPKASEASMGAFYFRERVNGCCHGACGYCYAIGVQHTKVANLGASW